MLEPREVRQVTSYYAEKLSAMKLFRVYDTGIERVRQYLEAEIDFVSRHLHGTEKVLELGAGYGRIMKKIAPNALSVLGIDISEESVAYGKSFLADSPNCRITAMDAYRMDYEGEFDVVICLQNGLSAIKGDAQDLVGKGIRALVPGGTAFYSTYSARFWEQRLEWFKEQSKKGLLGEIDWDRTKDGVIACRDGFLATTFSREDLAGIGERTGCPYQLEEVDESSLFLVLEKPKPWNA